MHLPWDDTIHSASRHVISIRECISWGPLVNKGNHVNRELAPNTNGEKPGAPEVPGARALLDYAAILDSYAAILDARCDSGFYAATLRF